jgi:hypothetical protein
MAATRVGTPPVAFGCPRGQARQRSLVACGRRLRHSEDGSNLPQSALRICLCIAKPDIIYCIIPIYASMRPKQVSAMRECGGSLLRYMDSVRRAFTRRLPTNDSSACASMRRNPLAPTKGSFGVNEGIQRWRLSRRSAIPGHHRNDTCRLLDNFDPL